MVEEYTDADEAILLEDEEEPADNAMNLTSALVITTFVILLLAHVVAQFVLKDLYGKGLLA